jgi:hypothetical protein
MAKAARHRASKLRRRKAFRDPRAVFQLYCEGKNSEPLYFGALGKILKNSVISVIRTGASPDALVRNAISEARSRGVELAKGDQVWIVFDRDEHAHFDAAIEACARNKFKVARSNPCFEVWLILHVEDFHRPDGRGEVYKHFCTLRPDYTEGKGRVFNFSELIGSILIAEERAERQLEQRRREGTPFGRPSTTVHELTRALRARG